MRMERPARATVFRRNRGAAGGEDNAATSIGVPATYRSRPEAGRYWTPTWRPLRRASSEEEVMPGMRAASRSRGRWWRRRPAHGKRDSGGRRWNSGGNATVLPARTRLRCFPAKRRADRGRGGGCEAEGEDGAAGRRSGEEGEAAGGGRRGGKRRAMAGTRLRRSPCETEGRPGWRRWRRRWRRRRRDRPVHGRGGTGGWRRPAAWEREEGGGERARDHGEARDGVKTIERSEGIPFYRVGAGAGLGRGQNGHGNNGRRPWKAAGLGASVPGD
uniref:OSJNBa0056L23.11 protein n=1 Tax=Oryza sativa subsp. japonica TaxID=39947 RepID=Q7XL46_ORYSJ|nr:OSJNBa0056L23.11 [Oryza sativa Japonica Group]